MHGWSAFTHQALTQTIDDLKTELANRFAVIAKIRQAFTHITRNISAAAISKAYQVTRVGDRHDTSYQWLGNGIDTAFL